MKIKKGNIQMAQFMGYGKSRAQSIIFANRTASGGITKGSQFSQTYWEERKRVYLSRQLRLRVKTCRKGWSAEDRTANSPRVSHLS